MQNKELQLTDNDIVSNNGRDVVAIAEQARAEAEIKATILMAMKFPRSEERAIMKIEKNLDDPEFAKIAYYSFPRGNTRVEGVSVVLAREFARNWGNLRYGVSVIQDDSQNRTVEGWAWDIETNTKVSSQSAFGKLIYRKGKGWIEPDERELRELTNKHGAICVRNSITQLLPKHNIDKCVMLAKKTIVKGITPENLGAKRVEILKHFENIGISQTDLENYLNVKTSQWTAEEIASLRGVWNSIKDGNMKKEELREPINKEPEKSIDVTDVLAQMKTEPVNK